MKYLFRNNNVVFVSAVFADVTAAGFKVTGTFYDYKKLGTGKGFSLKKSSDTEWTDSEVSTTSFAKTYSGLSADTQYDVRMYVTVSGVKQYSPVYTVTTEPESAAE